MKAQASTLKWIVLVLVAIPLVYGITTYASALIPSSVFLPVVANSGQATDLLKGYISSCSPMHWQTQAIAGVSGSNGVALSQNDLAGGPHSIVYSDSPDGTILGSASIWPTTFVLSDHLAEADWYLWVINGSQERASEVVSIHTNSELGLGQCQGLGVVFFSSTIVGLTPTAPAPLSAATQAPP